LENGIIEVDIVATATIRFVSTEGPIYGRQMQQATDSPGIGIDPDLQSFTSGSLFDLTTSARCGYCAAVLDGMLIGVLIVAEEARA
jgi:hypothetical protein